MLEDGKLGRRQLEHAFPSAAMMRENAAKVVDDLYEDTYRGRATRKYVKLLPCWDFKNGNRGYTDVSAVRGKVSQARKARPARMR